MFLYGTHPKRRTRDNSQPRFDHEDEPFDQGRYDCNINWCLYNVLMVEWKNGIAYRIGVGQVHIHAFDTKKNELADRPIRCLEKKRLMSSLSDCMYTGVCLSTEAKYEICLKSMRLETIAAHISE